MKEASGELNMTLVTIVAVGVILAIFLAMWPAISDFINESFTGTQSCPVGERWDVNAGACTTM